MSAEEIVTPAADGVVEGDLGMEDTLRQFCFTSGAVESAVLVRSILSWWGGGHGGGGGVGGSRADGESRAGGECTPARFGTFVRPLGLPGRFAGREEMG